MRTPRFTLRTMFATVTLLCIPLSWYAWHAARVRERAALLGTNGVRYILPPDASTLPTRLSPAIVLLGAVPVTTIYVDETVPEEVFVRIIALFPEAVVKRGTKPDPPL